MYELSEGWKNFRRSGHFCRHHSRGQTLLLSADEPHAGDTPWHLGVQLLARQGRRAGGFCPYFQGVGSRRDMGYRSVWYQSRSTRQPSSSNDTCTPESRYHAWGRPAQATENEERKWPEIGSEACGAQPASQYQHTAHRHVTLRKMIYLLKTRAHHMESWKLMPTIISTI